MIKEIRDKEEKDKKDREEKDKAEKASQDFQQASVKGPDILTMLIALQSQVEELAKDSKERKKERNSKANTNGILNSSNNNPR